MFFLECRREVNHGETRVMGLSSSENRIIVYSSSQFDMIPDCDRQTDRQAESIMLIQRSA